MNRMTYFDDLPEVLRRVFVAGAAVAELSMTCRPTLQQVEAEEHHQCDQQQHRGNGGGAKCVVAIDLPKDVDGSELSLEREVVGYQHRRPELADGLGEGQRRAGGDRRR